MDMPRGYRVRSRDFLAVTALADLDSNLSGHWRPPTRRFWRLGAVPSVC